MTDPFELYSDASTDFYRGERDTASTTEMLNRMMFIHVFYFKPTPNEMEERLDRKLLVFSLVPRLSPCPNEK